MTMIIFKMSSTMTLSHQWRPVTRSSSPPAPGTGTSTSWHYPTRTQWTATPCPPPSTPPPPCPGRGPRAWRGGRGTRWPGIRLSTSIVPAVKRGRDNTEIVIALNHFRILTLKNVVGSWMNDKYWAIKNGIYQDDGRSWGKNELNVMFYKLYNWHFNGQSTNLKFFMKCYEHKNLVRLIGPNKILGQC